MFGGVCLQKSAEIEDSFLESVEGIVAVVVIGGAWPICVRPDLYATMHMFRCDGRL